MKTITTLLIGMLLGQNAFAYTKYDDTQCAVLYHELESDSYNRMCGADAPNRQLSRTEFENMSKKDREALIRMGVPRGEDADERVWEAPRVASNVGASPIVINNNLPEQPAPVVVRESASNNGILWFLVGALAAGGTTYYLTKIQK